jgi:hypothetical protein
MTQVSSSVFIGCHWSLSERRQIIQHKAGRRRSPFQHKRHSALGMSPPDSCTDGGASPGGAASRGKEQAARRELPAGAQVTGLRNTRRHGRSRQEQLREVTRRAVAAAGNSSGGGGHGVRAAVGHTATQQPAIRAIARQAVLVAASRSALDATATGAGCS